MLEPIFLEFQRKSGVLLTLFVLLATLASTACNDQARIIQRSAGDGDASGADVLDGDDLVDVPQPTDAGDAGTDTTGHEPDPLCDDVACEGCYRGVCYETCSTSQECTDEERCANGACIPFDCEELICGPNEVCFSGVCHLAAPCVDDSECTGGGACTEGNCLPAASCNDGLPNGTESDVDCGGDCAPCSDYRYCLGHGDCESGLCEGLCQPGSCDDSVANGGETDTDCGGNCAVTGQTCANGQACKDDSDCESGACHKDQCVSLACADGVQNGEETSVDCGGPRCAPCSQGEVCSQNSDCDSRTCDDGTCGTSSCTDSVQNGDETDVDCGGTCPQCANSAECTDDSDCQSGRCSNSLGKCVLPQCDNQIQDGTETDVDCGGTGCPGCRDGDQCAAHEDCDSQSCVNGTCILPSCNDYLVNGSETDIDCGGPACQGCSDGKQCSSAQDCASGFCSGGVCAAPSCTDGVRNGGEVGRDCGGPCVACDGPDVECVQASDCNTNLCVNNRCSVCVDGEVQFGWSRCGYKDRGLQFQTCAENQWHNNICLGEWFASCSERQEAGQLLGDAVTIDPDGPYDAYRTFEVTCEAGGWTGIDPCTAKNDLRGRLVSVDNAVRMFAFDKKCRPRSRDQSKHHTSHYSFRFPAGITEFYLRDYKLRANASAPRDHVSDLTLDFHQTRWHEAYNLRDDGGGTGDVSFGDAAAGGPITSFAKVLESGWKGTHDVLAWPLEPLDSLYVLDFTTSFRIGFGEAGSQWEGWVPWWSGLIFLRDHVPQGNQSHCCALCGNRFRYHRVEGVTSECHQAVRDYCEVGNRGAFVDAAWSVCAP